MALLVGARLASASLTLAHGSTVLISRMYPTVPHIERFDLRPDRAKRELDSSEDHLARIAIPYALSVHEDYVNQVKDDLMSSGVVLQKNGKSWNAENMHRILFASMGAPAPTDLATFDLLRRVRNSMIHTGGLVDPYLEAGIAAVGGDAETRWTKVVGRSPAALVNGTRVSVGAGEIMIAFSITRHLSKLVHEASLTALPRSFWLRECVQDFLNNHREHVRAGRLLKRKLENWAAHYYEDLVFTWTELDAAARAAGAPAAQLRERVSR